MGDLADADRRPRRRAATGPGRPAGAQAGRAQWPAFQVVGEALHHEGYQGLITPSAARPGSRVLCVFRSSREVPGTDPIPPPRSIDEPPLVPPGMTT
ncbi:RES domain-containing protein [Baekduia alba]|uniref:RES domain-containing protein n=1 Tax=Baekduia alba TaxID=2997333 RepID=UPI003D7B3071